MKKILLAITTVAFIVSCNNKTDAPKADILAANLDSTIKPGEDFFEYANGGWLKKNPIPGEQSSWGIGNLVIEENLKRLKEISEKAMIKNCGILVNASRAIIYASENEDFAQEARAFAIQYQHEMKSYLE